MPSSLKSQSPQAVQESGGSWLLCLVSVLLEFGMDDFECGQEITEEEDEEGESKHEYLVHPEGSIPQCHARGRGRRRSQFLCGRTLPRTSTSFSQASFESDPQKVGAGE